jgi:hypothetical protein
MKCVRLQFSVSKRAGLDFYGTSKDLVRSMLYAINMQTSCIDARHKTFD